MSLVELKRYHNKVEADLARLTLEREGIHSVLMDEGLNNLFGGGPLTSIRLMVIEQDRADAEKILAASE